MQIVGISLKGSAFWVDIFRKKPYEDSVAVFPESGEFIAGDLEPIEYTAAY